MSVSRTPTNGSRKRSISDSESDRISSAVRLLNQGKHSGDPNHSPPISSNADLDITRSNPNISPLGSGLIETPLGVGLGTRFQTRNNPRLLQQQERAEKMCKDLISDLNVWISAMKVTPPPELLVVVDGYERFKRRIQRASEEAILRKLATHYTFQLSDYLVQLRHIKVKAERRDRRELNNLISESSTSTDDSEGNDETVFDDEEPPPISTLNGDNIQSESSIHRNHPSTYIEPETEKRPSTTLGRSPISKSLNDIIDVVRNSHQGESLSNNNLNVKIKTLEESMTSISNLCSTISNKLDLVIDNSSTNSTRITAVEHRVDELDRGVKLYIDSKINANLFQSSQHTPPLHNNTFESLKREIKSLKRKQQSDECAISLITETIANVKQQVDSTLDESRLFTNESSYSSRSKTNRDNERSLMRESIENSAKLIRQLIATKISTHSDLNTIKKSNDDIKKVNAYVKSCQDSLMKYVAFENFDENLVESVKSLLDQANNWILQVEITYSASEAHAVGNSKGDISNIGVFTDNAEKTVYEFIDEIEIGLLGWGTSKQRAAQIYNRHLSEDIKSRTLDCSDNFSELKKWLIKEFGSPSRIIGDVIADLKSRSKPPHDDVKAKYNFYSNLGKSFARLDKLVRVPSIDIDDLESALYSRSTLTDLINLLPPDDLNQIRRQMVKKKLDWKNPSGIVYFAFLKSFIDTEWDLLGPFKVLTQPPKVRSTHFVEPTQQGSFNINAPQPSYPPQKKPWYTPGLKFPCPINQHNHEMSECKEFLTMQPKARWDSIEKFRICYTCLQPKDVCTTRPCPYTNSIPEILLCQPCSIESRSKHGKLSPLSVLMCRRKLHGSSRAPPGEMHKELSTYLGCTGNNKIPQDIQIQFYSINFMYQAYSLTPAAQLSPEKLKDSPAPPPLYLILILEK